MHACLRKSARFDPQRIRRIGRDVGRELINRISGIEPDFTPAAVGIDRPEIGVNGLELDDAVEIDAGEDGGQQVGLNLAGAVVLHGGVLQHVRLAVVRDHARFDLGPLFARGEPADVEPARGGNALQPENVGDGAGSFRQLAGGIDLDVHEIIEHDGVRVFGRAVPGGGGEHRRGIAGEERQRPGCDGRQGRRLVLFGRRALSNAERAR